MADHEMPESPDIPPELMKSWIGGKDKPVPKAHEKPGETPPPKPPKRDSPPDDGDDPFGGYYPDDEPEEEPEESPLDEKVDEVMNNSRILVDRFRSLGNIAVSIEGQCKAIAQGLGLNKKGGGGEGPEPADNKLLKQILEKLDDLVQNGVMAQLSEEFDNLKPDNIKAMLDAFDKKLRQADKVAKSYAENLDNAMKKATMAGLVWGLCAGLGGSVICSLLVAFLLR